MAQSGKTHSYTVTLIIISWTHVVPNRIGEGSAYHLRQPILEGNPVLVTIIAFIFIFLFREIPSFIPPTEQNRISDRVAPLRLVGCLVKVHQQTLTETGF